MNVLQYLGASEQVINAAETKVIQESENGVAFGLTNTVPEGHHELFLGLQSE